jgi:hypothetical protein
LLILTTIRRLALPLFVFLAWTPAAYAWSWPVQGPVLQPFSYDEAHPYDSGQHRGIDIGADSAGESVVAPAAGRVSFAGSVPTSGKSVTIETADGYSVTLTHLGSITVVEGATVAEQDAIGAVGPSGTPEETGPYVHLGIRLTADPTGYVDPLGFLPPPSPESGSTEGDSSASQPSSSATAPASKPARPAPRKHRAAKPGRGDVANHEHGRVRAPRTEAQPRHSAHRPTARDVRVPRETATPRSRPSERTSASRRPVVEPAAPEPIGLGAGHAIRPTAPAAPARREPSNPLVGLVCNWAAALFALGAALAADRRRRRPNASPTANAEVLQLPQTAAGHGRFSRAA